jgi:hypothetical protein
VTSAEERTRAAMDAITGLVEDIPPLPLPPPAAAGSRSRRRRGVPSPGRRWGAWLTPLTAAVAVVAIAIALVVVRDMPGAKLATKASPAPPAGIPRYYLTFDQPQFDPTKRVGLLLGDTLTGKTLYTLQPPHGLSFAGITGAADDRTFVADVQRDPYSAEGAEAQSRSWYLLRVTGTGTRVRLTMTRLPVPRTKAGTCVEGIALSADGTKLAVATEPAATGPDVIVPCMRYAEVTEVLRVYSVATGRVLRSWSSAPDQPVIYPELVRTTGSDPNATLAWAGNHALTYTAEVQTGPHDYTDGVMVLELSHPDGYILASSHLAIPLSHTAGVQKTAPAHQPFSCGGGVITSDGETYVCGGSGASNAKLPDASTAKLPILPATKMPFLWCPGNKPAWNTVVFAGYSLTTGKLADFLSGWRTGCPNAWAAAWWASDTGSLVIGQMARGVDQPPYGVFGVFSHGTFWSLPIPLPGNKLPEYGGLENQVVW